MLENFESLKLTELEEAVGGYTGPAIVYVIKSGDTLSKIAARYNSTVTELCAINGIADANKIYAGATLYIPYRLVLV